MAIANAGHCSGWLFKSGKNSPRGGMNHVRIIRGAAFSAEKKAGTLPTEVNKEIERFTLSRVPGNGSRKDTISAVSRAIVKELNVGYNDDALVRINGEKTASDVFHEEGIDSHAKYRRFALCSEVSYLAVAMLNISGIDADCAVVSSPPFDSLMFAEPVRHLVVMPHIGTAPVFLDLTLSNEVVLPYTTEYRPIKEASALLSIHQNNSANMFAVQGRYFPAIEAANRALDADPNNGDAWVTKGKILLKKGDTREAEQCFLSSSESGSYFMNARFRCEPFFLLGELYFRQNSYLNASMAFKEAVRIYPYLSMLIESQHPEYSRFIK